MDRRNIWTWVGRQQRERGPAIRHRTPESGEAEPRLADLREAPLRLRRFRARELIEERRWDQTSPYRKTASLGPEVDDRGTFWRGLWPLCRRSRLLGWWEAPSDLGELVRAVFETADHRSAIGRPD